MSLIKPIRPVITEADRTAVLDVLISGYINDGEIVRTLEKEIGAYHNCEAVCVSSCTIAMELILRWYIMRNGSNMITVPYISHPATIHAAINAGYSKFECSDDPEIGADLNGMLSVKGIVADCAQSVLTSGIMSGREAVAVSFSALKTITGGVGGAVLTCNDDLIRFVRDSKSYGRRLTDAPDCAVTSIGSNYRMSDINAALALSQWRRRDEIITDKFRILYQYKKLLGACIEERAEEQPPWIVECSINASYQGNFRTYYPPFGTYVHLHDYIINWHEALKLKNSIFLPSWSYITYDEITKYASMIR